MYKTFTEVYFTEVYRKSIFSGVFTSFESFIPIMHKRGLIETLLHRSFRLCSSYENFHREIQTLKAIFKRNNYPQNFLNQCIKFFLNKLFIKKDFNLMVLKKELLFVLPCLGKLLLDLRIRLRQTIGGNLRYCKLKVILRSKCRLKTSFRFKYLLEKKNSLWNSLSSYM